jgi:sporulation protein YlmC with PRC-barrel domain
MIVENDDGERLGKFVDFALDLETGAPEFGIVKTSGAGRFAKYRAVPADCFTFASIKAGTLALGVTENRWDKAPIIGATEMHLLNQPSHRREVLAYYKKVCPPGQNSGPSASALEPNGRTAAEPASLRPMTLASDLIDNHVFDEQGKRIAKVSDVLIDPQGRNKTMLIISTGSLLQTGRRYAVPFEGILVDENKDAVNFKPTVDLKRAKPFDWTHAATGQVFAYR